ncbi:unnamed protein product (mitochondrion) [Plasmodiophora brassicae]|uniref:Uncharacterized protein n=1 Tax=Plasmodiophora brassicae TaxID=37360 RepID=A0A3P3Y786_PLABS|nr:unnamed protein product [Plasmodiophora brassicae]
MPVHMPSFDTQTSLFLYTTCDSRAMYDSTGTTLAYSTFIRIRFIWFSGRFIMASVAAAVAGSPRKRNFMYWRVSSFCSALDWILQWPTSHLVWRRPAVDRVAYEVAAMVVDAVNTAHLHVHSWLKSMDTITSVSLPPVMFAFAILHLEMAAPGLALSILVGVTTITVSRRQTFTKPQVVQQTRLDLR